MRLPMLLRRLGNGEGVFGIMARGWVLKCGFNLYRVRRHIIESGVASLDMALVSFGVSHIAL